MQVTGAPSFCQYAHEPIIDVDEDQHQTCSMLDKVAPDNLHSNTVCYAASVKFAASFILILIFVHYLCVIETNKLIIWH